MATLQTMPEDRTVLIVDDNLELAENLAEIVEAADLKAEVAAGGEQALARLAQGQRYDLVITDMRMPGLSGLDVVLAVKRDHPSTPVVVLTAYARDQMLEQARQAGALSIFTKSEDLDTLLAFVRSIAAGESHILIVEDDDDHRSNVVELVLQAAEGVVPHPVPSARAALELCAKLKPSACIIDVSLPDAPGTELAGELRERFGESLPIVMVTGYRPEWKDHLEALVSLPKIRLFEKPFDSDELLQCLRELALDLGH